MSDAEVVDKIAVMSFEEAMKALETIVDQLDSGDIPLEKSIAIYERGAALQKHCEEKLRQAEMRVQKIVTDGDGNAKGAAPAGFE